MMKHAIVLIAAALALASCSRTTGAAGGCNFVHAGEIQFSSADAPDRIETRAFGETCDKAIGLLMIFDADGHPLWSWSAPLPRAFGDVFPADRPDHMEAFLESWARPALTTTQSAPEFAELAAGATTLDQLTYDDIRARDLPMLCHFSGTARQTCVFWEPAAGGAGHLLDRDAAEAATGVDGE